ncbi:YgaP-like transmembrane domain [Bradyrhizobium sp. HKCCYLS20291]|uniref:YgaP-like transmembrane domain n=1 Tax=Bradyrhizobium sp. HKCCYLS20291 TaxID=3420766 RepID=UPI003EB7F04E
MAWVRRNLRRPHQLARVIIGLGVAVVAVVALSGMAAWLLAAAGAGFALTGVVGYCPACAVAGIGSGGRS